MNWNDIRKRIRAVFFRDREERELDEELAFHIEMQTRKNLQNGLSAEESRRQAMLQFGRADAVKEECRDERRTGLVDMLRQDIRYALRGFRRAPAFAFTVIATISLGLGINTAAFTIFNAYILRPLAVSDPYSLYQVNWLNRAGKFHSFSWPQYQQLQKDNPAISEVHAVRGFQLRMNGRQCFAELVTGNYFSMLGVGAALGRTLRPSDSSTPGQGAVMVLSSRAWQNLFGSDPNIVGRKVLVHGYPLEVVGVAREGFSGLGDLARDFWVPITMHSQMIEGPNPFDQSSPELLYVIARLKAGMPESRARALLNTMAPRLTPGAQEAQMATAVKLESRATAVHVSVDALLILIPLIAVFVLVLLMACANVANMMLARALARQPEIGIRLSLGAARSRLICQLLTESILLALPGAVAGFVISQATVDAAIRFMMSELPAELAEFVRVAPLDADLRVFAFMIAAAVISGVVFGLAPALQVTKGGIVQVARGDFGHQFRPQRLRNALVLVQVSGCCFLLICAGILIRSSTRLSNLETGMQTRDVISIEIQEKMRDRVLSRLASEPLVKALAASTTLPFDSGFPSARVTTDDEHFTDSSYAGISPEFFGVLGIPLERGRNFSNGESLSASPVAIVSHTLAQILWPDTEPIGQALRLTPDARSHLGIQTPLQFREVRVIGVARDVNIGFADSQNYRTLVYFPSQPRTARTVLLLNVRGDVEAARQSIDKSLGDAVPGSVDGIHKLDALLAGRIFPFRMAYWVAAGLGLLAILLTISGIYGVLSYLVAQRLREIGVRMALGATAVSVVGLVVRQGLRLALVGICVGAAMGMGAWKLLASGVLAVRAFDVLPFAGGASIVMLACLAAAVFPSLRATRVQPMNTLRHD